MIYKYNDLLPIDKFRRAIEFSSRALNILKKLKEKEQNNNLEKYELLKPVYFDIVEKERAYYESLTKADYKYFSYLLSSKRLLNGIFNKTEQLVFIRMDKYLKNYKNNLVQTIFLESEIRGKMDLKKIGEPYILFSLEIFSEIYYEFLNDIYVKGLSLYSLLLTRNFEVYAPDNNNELFYIFNETTDHLFCFDASSRDIHFYKLNGDEKKFKKIEIFEGLSYEDVDLDTFMKNHEEDLENGLFIEIEDEIVGGLLEIYSLVTYAEGVDYQYMFYDRDRDIIYQTTYDGGMISNISTVTDHFKSAVFRRNIDQAIITDSTEKLKMLFDKMKNQNNEYKQTADLINQVRENDIDKFYELLSKNPQNYKCIENEKNDNIKRYSKKM